MKNWIYIIYIGLVGCLVSSCQQSLDEVVQESTIGKAEISFTIALDDIDSRSRVSWEDSESELDSEIGSVNDNQIDLSSENGLQVFVYTLDGTTLLGEVTDKDIYKISTNVYKFNGKLSIQNLASETLQCRLMVFANCTNGTETFNYNVQYIPMWGVKETTLKLAKGELTDITEPIYLLRAMAKVEVKLDLSIAEDFDITSVKVNKYNVYGNVLPNGASAATSTEEMNLDAVFNPNVEDSGTDLYFTKVTDDEFYVYLPEYDNSIPATIKVEIDKKFYEIKFENYVDGKASGDSYNLVRNHYYQYTITNVVEQSVEVNFTLKYQVMDWTNITNPGLSFE